MTRWLLAGLGAAVLVGLYRVIAVGRKAPKTLAERRAAAWGGMPARYRQTQTAHHWKLRIPRLERLRKRA